jgi:para-aminobenzoate synthetase/4-amino-4-deoxychorismate lyase
VIKSVERALRDGLYVAGFLTYEAAPGFDRAFVTRPPGGLPSAWFGVFRDFRPAAAPAAGGAPPKPLAWEPEIDWSSYEEAFARVRSAIAAGDTYQANLTFRLRAPFSDSPLALCRSLLAAHGRNHAALVQLEGHTICCASPELFFRLDGRLLECRPMKGTIRRGLTAAADRRAARSLRDSVKNRAENLMIVDMVRNDLGRVAEPGTVQVPSLFDLEKYDYVHQLTSTVTGLSDASPEEIFRALFPSASITGAPKVSTMALLAELEASPRGIYTGSVGWLGPRRRGEFNVAIRTLHFDHGAGRVECGTGGGVVWNSRAREEYEECATKTLFLNVQNPRFDLVETFRWEPEEGFLLLDRHLERLAASAGYFDFDCSLFLVRRRLEEAAQSFPRRPQRVRLRLASDGRLRLTTAELEDPVQPWRLALAAAPTDPANRFLYHKTTERTPYKEARAGRPGYDDVLLWTPAGHLTESTVANLVAVIDGRSVTPPVETGLLGGTLRAELLARGDLTEGTLERADLERAQDIFLVNSVRGRIPVASVAEDNRTLWRNSRADDT